MKLEDAKLRAKNLFGPLEPPQAVRMVELGRREGEGLGFFEQIQAMTPAGFPIPVPAGTGSARRVLEIGFPS